MLKESFKISCVLATVALSTIIYSSNLFAEAPSPESIKRLFEVSKVKEMMDLSLNQIDQQTMSLMQTMLAQVDLSEEEKQQAREAVSHIIPKIVAKMKNNMSWGKLEPEFTRLYQETFTEEEIRGIIEFYESPAGEAMLIKMPLLLQNAMAMTQKLMNPFIQEITEIIKTEVEQLEVSSKANIASPGASD